MTLTNKKIVCRGTNTQNYSDTNPVWHTNRETAKARERERETAKTKNQNRKAEKEKKRLIQERKKLKREMETYIDKDRRDRIHIKAKIEKKRNI